MKSKKPTVLAVDDNPIKAYTLARMLESANFKVQTVHCGREAIAAAALNPYDAIVLDVHMPDVDGFDVCATIRAEPDLRQPAIIFHSATDASDVSIEKARAAGADAFLAHPIERQALAAVVLHYSDARSGGSHLLGSWKEIANYLGRGVRTVQRLEKERGLPVHRPGNKGMTVFADTKELRAWLTTGPDGAHTTDEHDGHDGGNGHDPNG
jgi:excisionase family DNA binding protein